MDPRSTNVVIAIATVLAVLLAVIALVGKDMAKLTVDNNTANLGLWEQCVTMKTKGTQFSGDTICGKLDGYAKDSNLLKVARPFAGVSLLLVVVAMILALLGAQTSKKGLYVALLILLVLGALGAWVAVILVAVFKSNNTNAGLGASWIVYIVSAGLASLGAVFSGIGVKASSGPGAVTGSLSYEA